MGSENFYADLPIIDEFIGICRPENYADLPGDWHVVVADVEGSSEAVRSGRYKDVNILGASSIIAVLNAARPVAIPFVFGGDGASLCIPQTLLEHVREALLATRRLAENEFKLTLRVGIMPVKDIVEDGFHVRVARYRASSNYIQAAFTGGGLLFAEQCIKDQQRGRRYRLSHDQSKARGDFSGLECRWDNIPSPHGEIVTLLVQAAGSSSEDDAGIYRDVIEQISLIYGGEGGCCPIHESHMRLTLEKGKLQAEVKVRAAGRSWFYKSLGMAWVRYQTRIGRYLMAHGVRLMGVNWGRYKHDVVANTDYRKFDGVLRHVLSGTAQQRQRLTAFLQDHYERGRLAYGLHTAPTALMTCLIFQRQGDHVHFVDGADGGYTLAADDLKRRLRAAAQPV